MKEIAQKYGALLIFDEIVTGFRLARGGAQAYFGVTPDLACFAKGMANGMPVAAVVGRREVMEMAERLIITTTYGGEALSLSVLVAALREYKERDVFGHIWEQGKRFMEGFNAAAEEMGIPAHCRGLAPMSLPTFEGEDEEATRDMWSVFLAGCAKLGVLFRRGGVAFITYSHTEEDIDQTVKVCREVFGEIRKLMEVGKLSEAVAEIQVGERFRRF